MNTVKSWVLDTAERALSTAAEATLAMLPLSYVPGVTMPLAAAFVGGGFAALVSVLKCLAALKVGAKGTASLLPEDA